MFVINDNVQMGRNIVENLRLAHWDFPVCDSDIHAIDFKSFRLGRPPHHRNECFAAKSFSDMAAFTPLLARISYTRAKQGILSPADCSIILAGVSSLRTRCDMVSIGVACTLSSRHFAFLQNMPGDNKGQSSIIDFGGVFCFPPDAC